MHHYIEWNLHGIADNEITSNLKSKHTIPVNDIISTINSPQLVATNHKPQQFHKDFEMEYWNQEYAKQIYKNIPVCRILW